MNQPRDFKELTSSLEGDFFTNSAIRTIYATDASAYRQMPAAVAMPRTKEDIKKLIRFASENSISLIPRTAGTSLAGQVVGDGIVVDVSKYMTSVLEVNQAEKWVRVQPGVIRDELNHYLKDHNLFFGPETATANRAMIGGMVGNNSCGTHSIIYGSTRDHTLEVKAILSDGSEVVFGALSVEDWHKKKEQENLEGQIYRELDRILSDAGNQEQIRKEFPKSSIRRRNTGYAIDVLLEAGVYTDRGPDLNLCNLICGSEGTLAFITEIKLNCVDIPPPEKGVVCVHLHSIIEATKASLVARRFKPDAVELIDDFILECTKTNIQQSKNREFVEGDPEAIIVVEFARTTREEVDQLLHDLIIELKKQNFGYHYPTLYNEEINKVWTLRKAGLGLLSNVEGDAKPVPCIEDTAVTPEDLPEYLGEFHGILNKYDKKAVHYAHIGDGELHLRPVLDLKKKEDRQLFYDITNDVAGLVKKYKGSLSGEHGDGRVRAPFIKKMVGEHNYELLREVKQLWDPQDIFNPGKIVDAKDMLTDLRYNEDQETRDIDTYYSFKDSDGILRLAEKCNGSGDCRKTELSGGTMCPSYHATREEKDTTRARANVLREFLTRSEKDNPFDHSEIKEILDLCLSCKGCKSECPSNVDMAKLKGEWQQHYYDANGVPFRSRLIGNFDKANRLASLVPGLYNFFTANAITGGLFKSLAGFASERSLPKLHSTTLRKWWNRNQKSYQLENPTNTVALFCDEFTNYNDTEIGIKAIKLLTRLNYQVVMPEHEQSGRTYMSKGLLKEAREVVNKNIVQLSKELDGIDFLLGVEPSAILSLQDEYKDLCDERLSDKAAELEQKSMLIEEFIVREYEAGRISAELFSREVQRVRLHGHCHQKAISSVVPTKKMLSIPSGYEVLLIPSGCCGMAGSFGYEQEHYDLSMKVGETVLFPTVRSEDQSTIIAAPGTSCRHQIKDGTGRVAQHPVEVLYNALA